MVASKQVTRVTSRASFKIFNRFIECFSCRKGTRNREKGITRFAVIYVGNVLFGRIGHGGSRGNTWKRRGITPLEDKLDFLGPWWWPRDACKGLGILSIYDGERRHLWGNSGSFSCSVSCASENDPSPRNGYSLSECRFESREIQSGELFLSRRARSVKGAVCIKRFRDEVYFC